MVSPEIATDHPNQSAAAPSEAVNLACWVQIPPTRVYT
jgi:hypothetical protein